jgi:hypothetical protein
MARRSSNVYFVPSEAEKVLPKLREVSVAKAHYSAVGRRVKDWGNSLSDLVMWEAWGIGDGDMH